MDPNDCWGALADSVVEAIRLQDWEEPVYHAENLLAWLDRGGFPPKITGFNEFDRIVAKATCQAIAAWEVV